MDGGDLMINWARDRKRARKICAVCNEREGLAPPTARKWEGSRGHPKSGLKHADVCDAWETSGDTKGLCGGPSGDTGHTAGIQSRCLSKQPSARRSPTAEHAKAEPKRRPHPEESWR